MLVSTIVYIWCLSAVAGDPAHFQDWPTQPAARLKAPPKALVRWEPISQVTAVIPAPWPVAEQRPSSSDAVRELWNNVWPATKTRVGAWSITASQSPRAAAAAVQAYRNRINHSLCHIRNELIIWQLHRLAAAADGPKYSFDPYWEHYGSFDQRGETLAGPHHLFFDNELASTGKRILTGPSPLCLKVESRGAWGNLLRRAGSQLRDVVRNSWVWLIKEIESAESTLRNLAQPASAWLPGGSQPLKLAPLPLASWETAVRNWWRQVPSDHVSGNWLPRIVQLQNLSSDPLDFSPFSLTSLRKRIQDSSCHWAD